jgi:hypothetical protein
VRGNEKLPFLNIKAYRGRTKPSDYGHQLLDGACVFLNGQVDLLSYLSRIQPCVEVNSKHMTWARIRDKI